MSVFALCIHDIMGNSCCFFPCFRLFKCSSVWHTLFLSHYPFALSPPLSLFQKCHKKESHSILLLLLVWYLIYFHNYVLVIICTLYMQREKNKLFCLHAYIHCLIVYIFKVWSPFIKQKFHGHLNIFAQSTRCADFSVWLKNFYTNNKWNTVAVMLEC